MNPKPDIDAEKLRKEIEVFQARLAKLKEESSNGRDFLINSYRCCIRIRQCLLNEQSKDQN